LFRKIPKIENPTDDTKYSKTQKFKHFYVVRLEVLFAVKLHIVFELARTCIAGLLIEACRSN
jgi:hypothetical protein